MSRKEENEVKLKKPEPQSSPVGRKRLKEEGRDRDWQVGMKPQPVSEGPFLVWTLWCGPYSLVLLPAKIDFRSCAYLNLTFWADNNEVKRVRKV